MSQGDGIDPQGNSWRHGVKYIDCSRARRVEIRPGKFPGEEGWSWDNQTNPWLSALSAQPVIPIGDREGGDHRSQTPCPRLLAFHSNLSPTKGIGEKVLLNGYVWRFVSVLGRVWICIPSCVNNACPVSCTPSQNSKPDVCHWVLSSAQHNGYLSNRCSTLQDVGKSTNCYSSVQR